MAIALTLALQVEELEHSHMSRPSASASKVPSSAAVSSSSGVAQGAALMLEYAPEDAHLPPFTSIASAETVQASVDARGNETLVVGCDLGNTVADLAADLDTAAEQVRHFLSFLSTPHPSSFISSVSSSSLVIFHSHSHFAARLCPLFAVL